MLSTVTADDIPQSLKDRFELEKAEEELMKKRKLEELLYIELYVGVILVHTPYFS